MSPRAAALVPVLTLVGTSVAAAVVAQKYVPRYFAHKYRRQRQQAERELEQEEQEEEPLKNEMKEEPEHEEVVTPPRSSMAVAVLLQDAGLLFSVFGVCIMVITVLVSLTLVSIKDEIESPSDLHMFSPLMFVSMAIIAAGMLSSMLRKPSHHKYKTESSESTIQQAPAFVQRRIQSKEPLGSEPAKKRVSKCPLGFG
ncbi:hypothetical protein Poli38472_006774 [Pythium oligandrum]|uniref:Transmembrane protein n=1 Tax=Pythium oligandrum TaxID=41045 RepID=A0A8K1C5D4_PYTOL|nr:hypothetical protein Poli38472_006774 [Pythium oligandrum]|eukprot:TMW56764.1 hypothetical protein Poli38472_006774 [Pythium oligandrum]